MSDRLGLPKVVRLGMGGVRLIVTHDAEEIDPAVVEDELDSDQRHCFTSDPVSISESC